MRLAGVLLFGFAASCFNPDLAAVGYSCDDVTYFCPEGLSCLDGTCQSGSPPVDTAPTDMAQNPLPAAKGCASGRGYGVGADVVFACPGKFGTGSGGAARASALCAAGYALCKMPSGLNVQACQALSGFFAADVRMSRRFGTLTVSNIQCQAMSTQYPYPLFAGCGSGKNVVTLTTACSGYSQAIDCTNDQAWTCNSGGVLEEARQTNAADGVLCCKG